MHTDVQVLRVERKLFICILPVIDSFSETISWDIFISATSLPIVISLFVCLHSLREKELIGLTGSISIVFFLPQKNSFEQLSNQYFSDRVISQYLLTILDLLASLEAVREGVKASNSDLPEGPQRSQKTKNCGFPWLQSFWNTFSLS